MTVLRAIVGIVGLLTIVVAMSLVAFGWRLTEVWPPPSRKYHP